MLTPDQIYEELQALPKPDRLRVVERVIHDLIEARPADAAAAAIWADVDDDEFDEFLDTVRQARAADTLRAGDAEGGL